MNNLSIFYGILILVLNLTSCKNKYKEFYPTGELKCEVPLKSGKPHGHNICYYKNGNLKSKGTYINGIKTDTVFFYYDSNIKLLSGIRIYSQDTLSGNAIDYYKSGQIEAIEYIYPDGIHGYYKSYWPNGSVRSHSKLFNRELHDTLFMYDLEENVTFLYYYEKGVEIWRIALSGKDSIKLIQTHYFDE